jgi:hypothetical protein
MRGCRDILRFNREVVSDPAGGAALSFAYRGKIQSVTTKPLLVRPPR